MVSLKRTDGSVITTTTYLGAGDRIIVSSSDADGNITKVQWKIDDKAGEFTGSDVKSRLELPLTGLSNGTHTAEVTVTDNAGATATASTTFNVDAVAPTITSIALNGTRVTNGSTTNLTIGDAASLTVTATDSRGTDAAAPSPATIRIMEGTSVRATGTNSVTADLSKAADGKDRAAGPVTFTIIATDSAGNSTASTATLNFIAAGEVDNTKPTFSWLSPSGDYVPGNSTVNVRATATRSGSEVKEALVYTATCGTVVNGNWNTAGCEDGSKQVVTATVTIGGKAYSDTKTVTVDASAPTVQITSPNTGTEVTVNPVKVNLTATDAVSGVATVVLEASRDGGAFEQVGVLTTASGEITWAPSNGSYTLRAIATDRTGNRNTTTVTGINVKLTSSDKTAPTVNGLEILNRAASGVERGTVTAQVTATDADSGVAKVELFDGGTSLGVQTAGVGGKYTFTLDTTKLSDGAHTLRAVATDNVGLSSQTSLTIQTDNTAPAVTWLSPTDGSMVGGTVNLNATTNEGTVEYTVDGTPITGTSYTFKADGAHTITASATDKAGNTTTSSIKVTSDATAPTAQITSPAPGATITSNPVTVSVNGSDNLSGVKSLEVFANGTSIGTVNGESGTVTWAPQSGDYAITVIATDKAGNRSAAGTPVNVKMQLATADTTRPVFLTMPTLQPAPQNGLSRGNVVIDGNATDAETGISTVALFDGGLRLSATPSLSKNPDGSTRYAFTLDTRTLSDGPHTLVVQATNGVGLTENKEVAFNIDNTAPVLTWNAPSFVGPAGSLALDASSESGASITYATTCGSISGNTWNYKDCADGATATLTATATDPAGNTTSTTRTITVDKSVPTVQITSPQDGQTFTANPVKVSLSAADAVSGIKKVTLEASRDGGAFEPVGELTTATGDLTWVPGNGTYILRATAIDRTGQTATKMVNNLVVNLVTSDTQAPTVDTLTVPAGTQRGTVTLSATVSDPSPSSGIAKVELMEGSTSLGVQTTGVAGTYTFSVDTTKLTDGSHTLRAIVTDNVGKSGEKSATLQTDNTAPVLNWNAPSIVGASGTLLLNASSNEGEVNYATSCGEVMGSQWNYSSCADSTTAVLTATAKDAAGNVTATTRSITVDKSAPTVQITSPQAGQKFTSNPITINVTGTDNMGVDHIDVFNGTTKIGTVTGNQGSLTWAPPSGKYTLVAVATDRAGNTSTQDSKAVEVNLTTTDITAPTGEIKTNLTKAVKGLMNVEVAATDTGSGVATVQLYADGSLIGTQTTGVSGTYAFNVDTTKLTDGNHKLQAVLTDNAGNRATTPESVLKVNNTAPVVTITKPVNGSLLGKNSDRTVAATGTDTTPGDEVTLEYSVDGGAYGTTAPTLPETNGSHTVTVRGTDSAGNISTATSTVTVDADTPTVQITSPQMGQKFTSNPITINVTTTDNMGVDFIDVYVDKIDPTTKIGTVTGNQGSLTWAPTSGKYTLIAVATDRAGNTSTQDTKAVEVNLTTTSAITPREPTLEATSGTKFGTNPIFIRGLGQVSGSASSTTDIVSSQLLVDGQPHGTATTATIASKDMPVVFNFDFSALNEGFHDFTLRWTDSASVVKDSPKISAFVDKTAPVILWNWPAAGGITNAQKGVLNATATDAASGTKELRYMDNGTSVDPEAWAPVEGVHTLTAMATDNVGNTSTKDLTFTVDRTGPAITATSPTSGQEFTSGPVTISATATDNLTGVQSIMASIEGPKEKDGPRVTLGLQSGDKYSAVFTPVDAGTYTVSFDAFDKAGNAASTVTRTFVYSVTTPPMEKTPAPVLTVVGDGPYTGNMSVNVAGNFDSLSQVDRMILQITDKNGVIDNASYVTGQSQATFSVDTTKLANGDATLQVIAYTKTGLRGISAATTVQIQNVLNPVLAVVAPADGATITTPSLPVRITLTKSGNTAFQLPSNDVKVELLDSRGRVVAREDKVVCQSSLDAATYTCNYTFDIAALPADTYTIRTVADVTVNGTAQQLVTTSRFTSNTTSVLPPAATIRFPAITSLRAPARIDSSSGIMVNVSDNTGVAVVEARIVGPFDATKPLALNGTAQCLESLPVGNPNNAVNVLLLNQGFSPLISLGDVILPNLDIDGSAYVPDNNPNERYDLRVTVVDSEGNRNIQCIPVAINRAAMKADRSVNKYEATATTSPTPANTAPGELNYLSGKWTLTGLTNSSRVAGVLYVNGVQKNISFNADATGSADVTVSFGDEGVYSIKWLVEDMTTGIVTSVAGPSVTVKKNKE